MGKQIGWTRDQQLVALRLYMGTPFGKLHGTNPEVVELARRIGRSPGALAMKACNFAHLDPEFRKTNRKGLSGASDADRALWEEFSGNSEAVAAEAEEAFARFSPEQAAKEEAEVRIPEGETDVLRVVRARRVQSFFRAAVLTSYGNRCAISGLAVPELLVASHIIPWSKSVERRADPTNGICLNALFDRAFDRGFIALDDGFRVVVSRRLKSGVADAKHRCSLLEVEGQRVDLPARFPPCGEALKYHREMVLH